MGADFTDYVLRVHSVRRYARRGKTTIGERVSMMKCGCVVGNGSLHRGN